VLRFITKEIDPSNGRPEEDGYEDEYTLEDIDISPGDFIREMPISNFRTVRVHCEI
jgi:coatomer protein complex subunit gamma